MASSNQTKTIRLTHGKEGAAPLHASIDLFLRPLTSDLYLMPPLSNARLEDAHDTPAQILRHHQQLFSSPGAKSRAKWG